MDAQIKKGILELCLLQCLSRQAWYGYDLIRTMRRFFPEVSESTFYTILRRLHGNGAAEQFLGAESNGPPRKYYRITSTGLEQLAQKRAEWEQVQHIVLKVLKGEL